MATPRRAWFRAAEILAHEPISKEELGVLYSLMAAMNRQWARNGLSQEEAGEILMTKAQIFDVTGRFRLGSARNLLVKLGDTVKITIELRGDNTLIRWPKFPIFQQYPPGMRAECALESPPPPPPPLSAPASAHSALSQKGAEAPREGKSPLGGNPPKPSISHQLVTRTWGRAKAALERYGHPSAEELDRNRRARIRAILRDATVQHEELVTVLAQAVHGYVARCGLQESDGYHPLQGFKLSLIMSPERYALNFDAAQDALARGKSPPFQKGDNVGRPRRVRAAGPVLVGELGDLVAGMRAPK